MLLASPLSHWIAPFSLIHLRLFILMSSQKTASPRLDWDTAISTCKVMREKRSLKMFQLCVVPKSLWGFLGNSSSSKWANDECILPEKLNRAHTRSSIHITEQVTREHTQQQNKTQSINLKPLQIILLHDSLNMCVLRINYLQGLLGIQKVRDMAQASNELTLDPRSFQKYS